MSMKSNQNKFRNCGSPELSQCRKVVFAVISLAILLLLIYGNSFNCSWQFDDEPNITINPNIHLEVLTWDGVKKALFSNPKRPDFPYRPITCLTFALNYYFGDKNVFGYHLTNLVIHWISSVFLFLSIYHTLNLPKLKNQYGSSSYGLALLATVLWAINPVQVQAVTYIVQRMASLAGLFFIMSMYFYTKCRISQHRKRSYVLFGCCFFSFLMAIGSKENAFILPIAIFIYETLLIQRDSNRFFRNNLSLILIVFGFTILLAIGYLYFKKGNIFYFLEAYNWRPFTLGERLLTEPRVIFFYISLLIYPITDRLNIAHSFELSRSLMEPASTLIAILGIFLLVIISICISKKYPIMSFSILFFLLAHIIESSIIALEILYEHRNYIPSMFFFLPFVILIFRVFHLFGNKQTMQCILIIFVSLYMVGLGHATHLRNFDWKTPTSLWSDSLNKSHDIFRPYHNLANQYQKKGQLQKAIGLYNQALSRIANNRNNEKQITYYNMGIIYGKLKKYNTAITYYKRSLTLNPRYSSAHNNLAMVYMQMGKHDLARHHLFKGLEFSPGDPSLNLNVAHYYLKKRRPHKALPHSKIAMRDEKIRVKALIYQGIAYKDMGLFDKSAMFFEKAFKRAPRIIDLPLHLAEVYQKSGLYERALKKAERALALIGDKQTFQQALERLSVNESSPNTHPDGKTVIPLLQEASREKRATLKEWEEMLMDISI